MTSNAPKPRHGAGVPLSQETKARISEGLRAAHANPEYRLRISLAKYRAANAKRGYQVPQWVINAGLELEWHRVAARHGEEDAAAHCRRLKRTGAAAEQS